MAASSSLKRSGVWKFFTVKEADPSKATCNLCSKEISRGGKKAKTYATTGLRNHLEGIHKLEYQEVVKEEKDRDRASSPSLLFPRQPTLAACIERSKEWPIDYPQAKRVHSAIGRMMVLDLQPFSMVEDNGFRGLMTVLEPR
jgi:hypothetical protein